MDLETFFTTLYVIVDDWYRTDAPSAVRNRGGRPAQLSDSEVLTIALAGQWRVGVPWQSERGVVRYLQAHGRGLFPQMLERSAFNRRVRHLWNMFILLQQATAQQLGSAEDSYESVDCMPLPAYSLAQAKREKGHWLWQSTSGHGGTSGHLFIGDHLLLSVTRSGIITGWLLGAAHIQDRWLMEVFLSSRAGDPQCSIPTGKPRAGNRLKVETGHIGPIQSAGQRPACPYLADAAYNGDHWQHHWLGYGATVIAPPQPNAYHAWSSAWKRWLAARRQPVETAFACLDTVLGIKRLAAHSRWGQYTRIAAKTAAYNLGCLINRQLGRPQGALATLIV